MVEVRNQNYCFAGLAQAGIERHSCKVDVVSSNLTTGSGWLLGEDQIFLDVWHHHRVTCQLDHRER